MSSPGRRLEQVDVLDERHVLLVREALPGEELGVDRRDLVRLEVGELVAVRVVAHDSTARRSVTLAAWLASRSSSAFFASSRFTSPRISCSVTPTV